MVLAIIGNISVDTVYYPMQPPKSFFGGGGLNIAMAASRLGLKPKIISAVGRDAYPLLERINASVDTSGIDMLDGETCKFEIRYDVDGTVMEVISSFGVSAQIDVLVTNMELPPMHYHVCCRKPMANFLFLSHLIAQQIPFSVDFTISSIQHQLPLLRDYLEHARYVFVNGQEFTILCKLCDFNTIPLIIVTSDNQQVVLWRFGKKLSSQSYVLKSFVDVTGAGDVFVGTFLAAQLQSLPLDTSITQAIAAAQESLNYVGIWKKDG